MLIQPFASTVAIAIAGLLCCDLLIAPRPSQAQPGDERSALSAADMAETEPTTAPSDPRPRDLTKEEPTTPPPDQVHPTEGEPVKHPSTQELQPYSAPNLNPTQIPSAFSAEWGNYFLSSYIYGYDDGSDEGSLTPDGGISVGMGFGDSHKYVAVEIDFNLESLANTNNGGTLDVRVGRSLIRSHNFALQLGGGWLGVASYGTWPKDGGSPYGVLTAAWALRPHDPDFRQTLQVNLGGGGGRFQRLDAVDLVSSGLIASVGLELAPNLGISAGWAGRGLNATLSYVPLRGIPLSLSLSGANITNVDGTGRAVAFGVTWGGSFRTATFP